MIEITPETASHSDAVRQLTIEAFAASEFGHQGEADLIDHIRNRCKSCVSLVALAENQVVGHILFSPASLQIGSHEILGLGLAPMAVLPARQRQGIGSRLVTEGLNHPQVSSGQFVVVAGHPRFYPRFGFRRAAELGVRHGFVGMPQDICFLRLSQETDPASLDGGKVFYHEIFGPQHS